MAVTATGTMKITIEWAYNNAQTLSTIKDIASLSHSDAFTAGTSANQIDVVYRTQVTPTSSTPVDLNLKALADVFGTTIDFQTVRALFFQNNSSTATEKVLIGPLGESSPFITPWNDDADAGNTVGPGGSFAISSPIDGFDQGGGMLRISTSVSGGVEVDLVLLGVKT